MTFHRWGSPVNKAEGYKIEATGTIQLDPADVVNDLVQHTHEANKHWWIDDASTDAQLLVVPTKLMLVVSEIAEAMEGHRKNLNDDKLPHRPMIEVELVDAIIRIFDLAGRLKLDLGGAYVEKMAYNASRADHKPEARAAENGKKY